MRNTALAPVTRNLSPVTFLCDRCHDIGVRVSPAGVYEPCPAIVVGDEHADPSPQALMIQRAVMRQPSIADSHLFDVARTLAAFSTASPCNRFELIERHFTFVHGPEAQRRALSYSIQKLRDEMLLPVGSRKSKPSGYWIITDADDFETWFTEKKKQPLTELGSLHRLARTYWPVFAEQLELEFGDLGADQGSAIVN